MVEVDIRDHRDAAVPGVRRVQPAAQAHLDKRHVDLLLREPAEQHGGQQLELRRRPVLGLDARRRAAAPATSRGERSGGDGPAVDDDPLAVGHEVGLGRLGDAVSGRPQRGSRERDDGALAVRPGDERAARRELRVAQQRAAAPRPVRAPAGSRTGPRSVSARTAAW